MNHNEKQCPFCGEIILINAQKCRFCGEWLTQQNNQVESEYTEISNPYENSSNPYQGVSNPYESIPNPYEQEMTQVYPPKQEIVHQPSNNGYNGDGSMEPYGFQEEKPVSFFEAYFIQPFLRQYSDFSGLTGLKSFWMSVLAYFIVNIGLGGFCLLMIAVGGVGGAIVGGILSGAASLGLLVPNLALCCRRLRDAGKNPVLILLCLIPLVGSIILIVFFCMPTQHDIHERRNVKFLPADIIISLCSLGLVAAGVILALDSMTPKSSYIYYPEDVEVVEEAVPDSGNKKINVYNFNNPPYYLSTEYLTYNDISHLNKAELRILRNAIYAMHNRKFKSADLAQIFSSYSWYTPLYDEVSLSKLEQENVQFIKKYEDLL